jgi:GT2 family glycosyltransferase
LVGGFAAMRRARSAAPVPVPAPAPSLGVSVILVSYHAREALSACLTRVRAQLTGREAEIIVIDNASTDGSAEMVAAEFPEAKLIRNDTNAGFAAACNQGAAAACGAYLVLLNPDAWLQDGALDAALAFMEAHPRCALAGGKLLDASGRMAPSGRRFPSAWQRLAYLSGLMERFPTTIGRLDNKHLPAAVPARVDWVPGAFAVCRRAALAADGLFDEAFFLYYEEVDLCRRLRQRGFDVYFVPSAEVVHTGGVSARNHPEQGVMDAGAAQLLEFRMRSQLLYLRKHHGLASTLANAGLEAAWHALRVLRGRRDSADALACLAAAIKDTQWGTSSPPRPWSPTRRRRSSPSSTPPGSRIAAIGRGPASGPSR